MSFISNPFQMVVAIVAIVMLFSIIRSRHGSRNMRWRRENWEEASRDDPEKQLLREEVQSLKDRVAVLERIITDQSSTLEQEIEQLRDR